MTFRAFAIFGQVALDDDLLSDFQGVPAPSELSQQDGAAKLKIPVSNNSSGIFDIRVLFASHAMKVLFVLGTDRLQEIAIHK